MTTSIGSGSDSPRELATRPVLHFTAARGWINDPLGLTWHDGEYHLFYQYVPGGVEWRPEQTWGHASSPDLRTWRELPVAIAPELGEVGVWSGCIVKPSAEQSGTAEAGVMFYTGVYEPDLAVGRVRGARPEKSDWVTWRRTDLEIVAPSTLEVTTFRDPWVVADGGGWLMVVGAGLADGTGCILGYTSTDLEDWTYSGVVASRHTSEQDPVWTGGVWECPQLIAVDGRWVLLLSAWQDGRGLEEMYAVGDLLDGVFVPRFWGQLTYGEHFYAGSVFTDSAGRPGVIHWLRGVEDLEAQWAGAHSLPQLLHLDGDVLVASVHPEIVGTLAESRSGSPVDAPVVLGDVGVLTWELPLHGGTRGRGNLVLGSDCGDSLVCEVTAEAVWLRVGRKVTSIPVAASRLTGGSATGGAAPSPTSVITLVIDRSIVEVLTRDGITASALPNPGQGWHVFSADGSLTWRGLVAGS